MKASNRFDVFIFRFHFAVVTLSDTAQDSTHLAFANKTQQEESDSDTACRFCVSFLSGHL